MCGAKTLAQGRTVLCWILRARLPTTVTLQMEGYPLCHAGRPSPFEPSLDSSAPAGEGDGSMSPSCPSAAAADSFAACRSCTRVCARTLLNVTRSDVAATSIAALHSSCYNRRGFGNLALQDLKFRGDRAGCGSWRRRPRL